MRRKHFCLVGLLAIFLISSGQDAYGQGGGRGWLERLSGPGPFAGWDFNTGVACFGDGFKEFDWVINCNKPAKRKNNKWPPIWITFDYSRYDSEDDAVTGGTVKYRAYEGRLDFVFENPSKASLPFHKRVVASFEVGAGGGAANFRNGDFSTWKPVINPIRVGFKPLVWIGIRGKWRGILQGYYKGNIFAGRLTGADFGVPGARFDESWEFVHSYGFIFDLRALFYP